MGSDFHPPKQARHNKRSAEELWSEDQFVDASPGGFAELSPGDTIGKFRVIRELGKGGMGTVYLATHTTLQIEVALKILPPAVVRDTPQVAARFIREAQIAARIRHPNVVAVMDAEKDPVTGLHYIVLEYVSGGSLGDRLAQGPLSEDEALRVVYDVAQALVVAEEHGIVHRDIKPDNIMLDSRGIAKLADLGVAKQVMAKATNLTQEGSSIGTPAYMSPDQIRNAQDADTRDDIYSLGATLYELLTGQPPFDGSTAYNIVSKVLSSPTPDPRDLMPDLSPSVSGLCMKMMARAKSGRHASATALINDLERLSELGWGPDAETDIHEKVTLAGNGTFVPPSLEQMARRHANRYAESDYDQDDSGRRSSSRIGIFVLSALLVGALGFGAYMWLNAKPSTVRDTLAKTEKNLQATNQGDINIVQDPEVPVLPTPSPTNARVAVPPKAEDPRPTPIVPKTKRDGKNGSNGQRTTNGEIPTPTPNVNPKKEPSPFPETLTGQTHPQLSDPQGTNPFPGTELPPIPPDLTGTHPKIDRTPTHPEITPTPPPRITDTVPAVENPTNAITTPPIMEIPSFGEAIDRVPSLIPLEEEIPGPGPGSNPTPPRSLSAFEARNVAAAKFSEYMLDARLANSVLKIEGVRPKGNQRTPTVWVLTFFDPIANECYRRVTVTNGVADKPVDGNKLFKLLQWEISSVIPRSELLVDSDDAFDKVADAIRPRGMKLTSASFLLEKRGKGGVWKLVLTGTQASKGTKTRSLGEATVDARTGAVTLDVD